MHRYDQAENKKRKECQGEEEGGTKYRKGKTALHYLNEKENRKVDFNNAKNLKGDVKDNGAFWIFWVPKNQTKEKCKN